MDEQWALDQLNKLLDMLAFEEAPLVGIHGPTHRGSEADIVAQKVVVERIWSKLIGSQPSLPVSGYDPYRNDRDATIRCITMIKRGAEMRTRLGEDAPELSAAKMHPWIWGGAQSLWQSGHYAEAVQAAAKKLNAETQNKIGRRDISEGKLFLQAFSDDDPAVGRPRLRLPEDDGESTAVSVRRGIRHIAEGWFAAVRNPAAHDETDMRETEALEHLAALSLLARWVDRAGLHRAEDKDCAGI